MNIYVFRVTPGEIKLLCTVEQCTRNQHALTNSIDTVPVIAIDYADAREQIRAIRDQRIAFLQKIMQNPIQSIGQAGNGF